MIMLLRVFMEAALKPSLFCTLLNKDMTVLLVKATQKYVGASFNCRHLSNKHHLLKVEYCYMCYTCVAPLHLFHLFTAGDSEGNASLVDDVLVEMTELRTL